jgi:hypothetical protein
MKIQEPFDSRELYFNSTFLVQFSGANEERLKQEIEKYRLTRGRKKNSKKKKKKLKLN